VELQSIANRNHQPLDSEANNMTEHNHDSLEIRVELDSPIAVYRQIEDAIRALCVSGQLEPGSKLPTVRGLAASLGVHFNTVAQAYRELAADGWLYIAGRHGVMVQHRKQPDAPDEAAETSATERLRRLLADLQGQGFGMEWILKEVSAALNPKLEPQS
jgi:GntR family transcriptional regulator